MLTSNNFFVNIFPMIFFGIFAYFFFHEARRETGISKPLYYIMFGLNTFIVLFHASALIFLWNIRQ